MQRIKRKRKKPIKYTLFIIVSFFLLTFSSIGIGNGWFYFDCQDYTTENTNNQQTNKRWNSKPKRCWKLEHPKIMIFQFRIMDLCVLCACDHEHFMIFVDALAIRWVEWKQNFVFISLSTHVPFNQRLGRSTSSKRKKIKIDETTKNFVSNFKEFSMINIVQQ